MSHKVAAAADPEQLLRDAGLRVTRPRLAVLVPWPPIRTPAPKASWSLGTNAASLPAVSTQAVYDVLNVLADRGIARRIPACRIGGPL